MSKNLSDEFAILDSIKKKIENDGDDHILTNLDTPILDDAFDLSDDERVEAEKSKRLHFLSQGKKYIDLIKPNFYMPFAGTYILAGNLYALD